MRNRNMSQLVSMSVGLLLALIISVDSSAQTASPQTAPSAQTPQATPSPASPQTEPNQQSPAAGQQSTPNPSTTAPSQSAPPAAAQQGNRPGSIDEELQLTPDQKQKIAAVVDDENKQIGAVREDNSMSLEQKQQKVMQIRQAGTPKIKAILTPEQLQKLAAIQERMRQQNSQGGNQNGNQGTTQAPPQH